VKARPALALCLAGALAGAGCGGGGDGGPLRVSAASSLQRAFAAYGATRSGGGAAFSFAGSDELAAQIRLGGRPDVFAAANTRLPEQLFAAGLVERPVAFAANRLVLAVPALRARVSSLAGARLPGVRLAIGARGVPVGDYARGALGRLGPAWSRAVLANVRTEEPDVAGIVAKLTQGAVDAGFVYATDVRGAGGRLRAVELPVSARPRVAYAAAAVRGSRHRARARAFVRGLLSGAGARALRAAGFLPPPVT
jgi:molybdate transport system substrate-binding protein